MRLDVGTCLLLFVLIYLAYRVTRNQKHPQLPTNMQMRQNTTWRIALALSTKWFFWASIVFLAIALSHPRLVEEVHPRYATVKNELPRSGVAIYFLLDESGSMSEKVEALNSHGSRIQTPKIDLAKQAIMEFVNGGLNLPGRKDDLIGLIAFARVPEVLSPLTLNRAAIENKLKGVQPIQVDTRNGTAIGYAIFKAVNIIVATKHFAERQTEEHKGVYNITNQAIIIITDGLQSPHPDDKDNPFRFMPPDEAITYAKDNGVRVFYIGIDPVLSQSEYADDVAKMKKSMQGSGGELFLASTRLPIEDILSQIDRMEKSELPPEVSISTLPVKEESAVGLFIVLAMAALLVGVVLETQAARSIP